MKVKDLIERLKELDQETMVVVSGYEGGVHEALEVETVTVALNVNTSWYYGEHEVVTDEEEYPEHSRAKAVSIG